MFNSGLIIKSMFKHTPFSPYIITKCLTVIFNARINLKSRLAKKKKEGDFRPKEGERETGPIKKRKTPSERGRLQRSGEVFLHACSVTMLKHPWQLASYHLVPESFPTPEI